jgi:hypothetical protein
METKKIIDNRAQKIIEHFFKRRNGEVTINFRADDLFDLKCAYRMAQFEGMDGVSNRVLNFINTMKVLVHWVYNGELDKERVEFDEAQLNIINSPNYDELIESAENIYDDWEDINVIMHSFCKWCKKHFGESVSCERFFGPDCMFI